MKPEQKFVEACEALAETLEKSGRMDLSALCDKAGYWLNGGTGIDLISVGEIIESCRETLRGAFDTRTTSTEVFVARTTDEIMANIHEIERVVAAASKSQEDLIDKAAKLQAVAILTSVLFK